MLGSTRQAEATRRHDVAGDIEAAGGELEVQVIAVFDLDLAFQRSPWRPSTQRRERAEQIQPDGVAQPRRFRA